MWLLTLHADNRIFQNKSVPEIIEEVFSDLGLKDFKKSLNGTYAKREYCVQYQESSFDFVSRLMEDEGIFYYFEHSDGKHMMVLADDSDGYAKCTGSTDVRMGLDDSPNCLRDCTFEESLVKMCIRDSHQPVWQNGGADSADASAPRVSARSR